MTKLALGIIDAQRGFMPAEEGTRLDLAGFGELPVPNGQLIIPNVNRLLGAFAAHGLDTFTTQDWHPRNTAHFSKNPNFKTTWPMHCVAGEPGSLFHPDMIHPGIDQFIKGDVTLVYGEDDMSYSAYYSHPHFDKLRWLPYWLRQREITTVVLGGLALDYCVGKSALDFKKKLGLDVAVVADATAGISNESVAAMYDELRSAGVEITTTEEVLARIEAEGR